MSYRFRVTPEFIEQIDAQLPAERSGDGSPSAADFIAQELFAIGDHLIDHWDDLPRQIPGRSNYASYIGPGRLVYAFAVIAELRDDVITGLEIVIDLHGPQTATDDDPPLI